MRYCFLLLLVFSLYDCAPWKADQGPLGTPFQWSIQVHPDGENIVKIRIRTAPLEKESLAWADILFRSFDIAYRFAQPVDRLIIELPLPQRSGELYELYFSDYDSYKNKSISMSDLLPRMIIKPLETVPVDFFTP